MEVAQATEEARAQRDQMLPQIKGQYGATWFAGSPTSKFGVVGESGIAIIPNPDRPTKSQSVSGAGSRLLPHSFLILFFAMAVSWV